MELIGKLKKDVENSKDIKEARSIMEKAGMRLTDEELQQISGGTGGSDPVVYYIYGSKGADVYDNDDLTGTPKTHLAKNTEVTLLPTQSRKNVCRIQYSGGVGFVGGGDVLNEPFPG